MHPTAGKDDFTGKTISKPSERSTASAKAEHEDATAGKTDLVYYVDAFHTDMATNAVTYAVFRFTRDRAEKLQRAHAENDVKGYDRLFFEDGLAVPAGYITTAGMQHNPGDILELDSVKLELNETK